MMWARDSNGSDSDLDVQAVRSYLGAATGAGHALRQVQVEALERAEARHEVEAPRTPGSRPDVHG
jgi:hypothetical protein